MTRIRPIKVLGVTSYPVESAATRFRIAQFVGPLRECGIELDIRPFLSSEQFAGMYAGGGIFGKLAGVVGSLMRRIADVANSRHYDLLFVQREAMFFGPAVFEWLITKTTGIPMILDLDDATYVPYKSPTYGRLGSSLKFFGKTDWLIEHAAAVTCGNRFIAEYVEKKGIRVVVIPTVVNLNEFRPKDSGGENSIPVIGWIGTHSTFASLEWLFPVFQRLSRVHHFVLRVVGSGREVIEIPGVTVENLPWSLDREVEDFRNLDIGLYPIVTSASATEDWIKGKSGFKAVQYMAVGIPFVMSPVGVCAEIGVNGETHLTAESTEDWYNSLNTLLSDRELGCRMGREGRKFALRAFNVDDQVSKLDQVFRSVVDIKQSV